MQNKLFLKAADICELLEVKQTSAYEIIGNLNKELKEQGYLMLRGKVPTKYFVKRFYGVEDTCEIPQEEGKEWFHAYIRSHARYGAEVKQNLEGALTLRTENMYTGALGRSFSKPFGITAEELLETPTVIELADFSDTGTEFLMNILLFKLHCYISRLPESNQNLLLSGKLTAHLNQIDQEVTEQVEVLMKQMAEKQGVNENLKRQDQMKWVRLMNNIKVSAEEIVLKERVYM